MATVAYMLGARVIEKHFTLSHASKGTDHAFSLIPEGMRKLVRDLASHPRRDGRRGEAAAAERGEAAAEDGEEARRDARARRRATCSLRRPRGALAGGRGPAAVRARRRSSASRSSGRSPRRRRSSGSTSAPTARDGGADGSRSRRPRRRDATGDDELRAIGLVVFDFDGVFTDNRVWVNETGEESVACWRGDGIGLRRLDEVGVPYVIVSTEPNPVVAHRAEKLRARCVHDVADKLAVLREEAVRAGVGLDAVAYVGNDVNDASCLEAVGLPGRPGRRVAGGRAARTVGARPPAVTAASASSATPSGVPERRTERDATACVDSLGDATWRARLVGQE